MEVAPAETLTVAPVVALTATATPRVQSDIVAQLGLSSRAEQFIHGFRRHNLALEALEVAAKERPARARKPAKPARPPPHHRPIAHEVAPLMKSPRAVSVLLP